MKSERRHQLERNELADRLGAGITSVRPVLPYVLGGLAILAVVSGAWALFSNSSKQRESLAWTDYYFELTGTGGSPDDFLDVADQHPKTIAASWARETAGDSYLAEGIEALYQNRTEGKDKINLAIEAFEKVLDGYPDDSLRIRALIGLGLAHESLGNLDEAIANYQQVLSDTSLPTRVLSSISERVVFLRSESGKEFYTWFTALDPKPDEAIDLRDLEVPPTLESDPLEFSEPLGVGQDSQVPTPEMDLEGLGLPDLETPSPVTTATTLDELTLPEAESPADETSDEAGAAEPSDPAVESSPSEEEEDSLSLDESNSGTSEAEEEADQSAQPDKDASTDSDRIRSPRSQEQS